MDDHPGRARRPPYLTGPELTLAEIALGTMLYRWHAFPIERPPLKNLRTGASACGPSWPKLVEIPSRNGEVDYGPLSCRPRTVSCAGWISVPTLTQREA